MTRMLIIYRCLSPHLCAGDLLLACLATLGTIETAADAAENAQVLVVAII